MPDRGEVGLDHDVLVLRVGYEGGLARRLSTPDRERGSAIRRATEIEHHGERCTVSLERDFCRWRLARQKRHLKTISGAETGNRRPPRARMGAKAALLLVCVNIRVSEDWTVGAPGLEPGTR